MLRIGIQLHKNITPRHIFVQLIRRDQGLPIGVPYIVDDGFCDDFTHFRLASSGAEEVSLEFDDYVRVGDGVDVEVGEVWVWGETGIA